MFEFLLHLIFSANRIKEMNEDYPHFNEKSEGIWDFNKKRDEDIENAGKRDKITVSDMDPFVLRELCFTPHVNSLPTVIDCHHSDQDKYAKVENFSHVIR